MYYTHFLNHFSNSQFQYWHDNKKFVVHRPQYVYKSLFQLNIQRFRVFATNKHFTYQNFSNEFLLPALHHNLFLNARTACTYSVACYGQTMLCLHCFRGDFAGVYFWFILQQKKVKVKPFVKVVSVQRFYLMFTVALFWYPRSY